MTIAADRNLTAHVPAGWSVVALKEVLLTSQYGLNSPSGNGGAVPIVGMKDIQGGRVDVTSLASIDIDRKTLDAYRLRPGDILLNRTNSPDLVGKIGIFTGDVLAVFASYLVRLQANSKIINPHFLNAWLNANPVQHIINRVATRAISQANINPTRFLEECFVPIPPLPEQRRIAAILGTWDAAIEKAERLARLAAEALAARRTLLLSARHNRYGSEWGTVTFGDVTEELTSRNGNLLTAASVMGVIKGDGFQPMRERTIGSDLSRYKIVLPSAFAYNPMRLNIGSLAFSTFETDILVSPDYVVFAAKRDACAPEFLNELRQSPRWAAWCQQGGSGSVRTRIYYSDLIGMPIDLPTLTTQRQIAAVLADMAERHQTAFRRVELLCSQKVGLMQKLLTGKIRVPEAAANLSPAAD